MTELETVSLQVLNTLQKLSDSGTIFHGTRHITLAGARFLPMVVAQTNTKEEISIVIRVVRDTRVASYLTIRPVTLGSHVAEEVHSAISSAEVSLGIATTFKYSSQNLYMELATLGTKHVHNISYVLDITRVVSRLTQTMVINSHLGMCVLGSTGNSDEKTVVVSAVIGSTSYYPTVSGGLVDSHGVPPKAMLEVTCSYASELPEGLESAVQKVKHVLSMVSTISGVLPVYVDTGENYMVSLHPVDCYTKFETPE